MFNPATVNLRAYKLGSAKKKYKMKASAYIVRGEALNYLFGTISRPVGTVRYLPQQYATPWWVPNGSFRTALNFVNSVANHSTSAVIKALKAAGYK
jgi:hypothetical protein